MGLTLQFYLYKQNEISLKQTFYLIPFQLLLLLKAGPNWEKYFTSRSSLLYSGITGGLIVRKHFKIQTILKGK